MRFVPGPKPFELLSDVRLLCAVTQKAYTFDRGYRWNGASVPGFSLVSIADRLSGFIATLPHDNLIEYEREPPDICDEIFLWVMPGMFHSGNFYQGHNEPSWRRSIMYQAVNKFGPHHFENADGLGFQLPMGD